MNFTLKLLLIILIALWSCDIPKRIIVKNLTKQSVNFKWAMNSSEVHNYKVLCLFTDTTNTILDIELKRKIKLTLCWGGFGGWNNEHISEFANLLNFIEVKGATTNLKITDKQEIIKFLSERIKRYKIKIEIN